MTDLDEAGRILEELNWIDRPTASHFFQAKARVFLQQDNPTAAMGAAKQALALREEVYGGDHAITGQSLFVLGQIAEAVGDLRVAGLYYEHTIPTLTTRAGAFDVNLQEAYARLKSLAR